MMRIVGIDPGLNAAATLVTGGRGISLRVECVNIPKREVGSGELIDARAFQRMIRTWRADFIYFENIHAFLGQGLVSGGIMMHNTGILHGIAECEMEPGHLVLVTPPKWKAKLGLLKSSKKQSIARVIEIFPQLKDAFGMANDHNRAESAAIAAYGADRNEIIELPRYG